MSGRTTSGENRKRSISGDRSLGAFTGRLLVVVVIAALAAALWRLIDVLVLLFGAILLAIGLSAMAKGLARRIGVRQALALAGVAVVGLVAFGAAFWLFGSVIAAQLNDVLKAAPAGFKLVMDRLTGNPYGRQFLDQVRGMNVAGATGWATSAGGGAIGSIAHGLGYAAIALFMAIYLAAQPDLYRHLCIRLVPPDHRLKAEHLFDTIGNILERWLVGQLVVMCTIGVLTGIGLWLLGIEAAFALGLMGGLLCFIPFVGAILAAIPATLVALAQGPADAAVVILMYAGVHFIEGNFITPMVQAEATSLPPVLALLSTVAFGLLFGPLGVLLAAPLTLLLIVTLEVLYVQQGLGDPPEDPLSANGVRSREDGMEPIA